MTEFVPKLPTGNRFDCVKLVATMVEGGFFKEVPVVPLCAALGITDYALDKLLTEAVQLWDDIVESGQEYGQDRDQLDYLREQATTLYGSDDIVINELWPSDVSTLVEDTSEGAWVRAWLWCPPDPEQVPEGELPQPRHPIPQ
jgi:hypothetical protein